MADHSLPYTEPGISTILILSLFILSLNVVGFALDRLIYCGLLGQVFLGVAWGTPGGFWLSTATQKVFVQLGYLGLILIVFEGGLSTSIKALNLNLFLSTAVALTGIAIPICLSFTLIAVVDASSPQAFAAGAALCSTSLGTAFTVLKTSGLTKSRLGVVLTSAAMLDDMVGLVMVQVISNLGIGGASFSATTVVRPVGVALAFAIIVPLACCFLIKPLALKAAKFGRSRTWLRLGSPNRSRLIVFLSRTAILIGFVVGSAYAGTSNLFAAYLAGASISWYDSHVAPTLHLKRSSPPPDPREYSAHDANSKSETRVETRMNCIRKEGALEDKSQISGHIPASHTGPTRRDAPMLPSPAASDHEDSITAIEAADANNQNIRTGDESDVFKELDIPKKANIKRLIHSESSMTMFEEFYETPVTTILKPLFFASIGFSIPISQMFRGFIVWRGIVYGLLMILGKLFCGLWLVRFSKLLPKAGKPAEGAHAREKEGRLPKPKSLYPAAILGCAMVARGEIGFLISSVAESRGIFTGAEMSSDQGSSELFLIVTWAIMLCTIAGPIAVGLLTRRVRRLQQVEWKGCEGRDDPLGIWAVT